MRVKTNINVSFNSGLIETTSGLVEGEITRKTFLNNGGIRVAYEYSSGGAIIKNDIFSVPAANVEAMYNVIKAGLPSPDAGFATYMDTVFYEAFKIEMIGTFPELTATSEIDII